MITMTSMTPGAFLRQPMDGPIKPDSDLSGFGGVHGGLTLGLLVMAMQNALTPDYGPNAQLRSAVARYHRPITEEFQVETSVVRAGRSVATLAARVDSAAGIHVDATAIFATPRSEDRPGFGPPAPAAPPPQDCELYFGPTEFVPILSHLEFRFVGANRPFTGSAEPELTGWVRMIEDEEPPDVYRLAFLMDALAPSYGSVLSEPTLVPTIELAVRPGGGLATASSPWVLLRARTRTAGPDGWIDEEIDAWGPDGAHLGSAQQLRLVLAN